MFFASVVLPTPVWSDENHVGGIFEKIKGHERFDGCAIAAFGPLPIEIANCFESSELRAFQTTFEAAAHPFLFFPLQEWWQPRSIDDVDPVGEQSVKPQRLRALA